MRLRRSPDRRRARQLAHAPEGPLRDYLARPFPDPSEQHTALRLLAVDLETTGLEPARDHILSIGFVPVDGLRIVLSGARQLVVRSDTEVGQSAAIHGLTDDAVAAGVPLADALAACWRPWAVGSCSPTTPPSNATSSQQPASAFSAARSPASVWTP